MANPQKENGFVAVANEIALALSRMPSIGGEGSQLLWFVLRYTYGFNRKEAELSLSFIAKGTGLRRSQVSRAIKRLATKRLLVRRKDSISFNKNYDEWGATKRLPGLPNGSKGATKRYPKGATKRLPKKETIKTTKERHTQAPPSADAGDGVNTLMTVFRDGCNPGINYGNKTLRAAAKWLIDKYGLEKSMATAAYAVSIQGLPYAPTVTTPLQLKEKIGNLIAFSKRKTENNSYSKIDL